MKRFKAQHTPQKNRKSKKERFWAGSGKFLLVVIVIYALVFAINEIVGLGENQMQNFVAENVEIIGNEILNKNTIIEMCDYDFKKVKSTELDIENIAASLLKSDYIKGVSVSKILPRTLKIIIEERKPIAFIYGRGLNLIDDEGYLMPVPKIKKSWDLPFITGIKESLGKLGDKTISQHALQAIQLVSYMEFNDNLMLSLIAEINMKNDELFDLTMVKGGAKVRINRTKYEKELYVLQNYVKSYLDWSDMAQIDYIDLRFKDQLIVKKKT